MSKLAIAHPKRHTMKKVILACLALAIASSIINGCRAEGETPPDGHVATNLVAPQ